MDFSQLNALATPRSAKAWAADITAFSPSEIVDESLIMQTSTVCGSIEGDAPAVRVMYVDDADAEFVAEGNEILPPADPKLSEVVVYTGKVAQLIRVSREQWVQPNAEVSLSESARRSVIKRANQAYLGEAAPQYPQAGDATALPKPNVPVGLMNLPGLLDGGTVDTSLDALIDLTAAIEDNGGTPSHIICSPTTWASLRKLKTATGSAQTLLGAGVSDAQRILLDLPVLVTSAMPAGQGMVVDSTAIASAVGPVLVAQSEDVFFTSDSIAVRVTWRIGANLVHPERVGRFAIPTNSVVAPHIIAPTRRATSDDDDSGYKAMTVSDLNYEIQVRNTNRDAGDIIQAAGSGKAAMIAALEADDAKHA